ncbi:MAG: imidazole glycerol phosphate synthase subunit HisH, partial [Bacteroidetes bacterium]|nr:imidazole glycerol phosphate synthase subunit HisH [Bacteroidota bacterium]
GMDHSNYFYFVHSYYVPLNMDTAAQTEYIVPFSAVMCRDNFHAVQFHPERSGRAGERLLKNFLRL